MMRTPRPQAAMACITYPMKPIQETTVEPTAAIVRTKEQETPEGLVIDYFLSWHAEEGRRCRYCPKSKCNFEEKDGIGSCIIRRLADDSGPLPFFTA